MPPLKSPSRKRGTNSSRMICAGEAVGQHALEAVADLDSNLAFGWSHQHQHAVVLGLLTDTPRLEHLVGVLVDATPSSDGIVVTATPSVVSRSTPSISAVRLERRDSSLRTLAKSLTGPDGAGSVCARGQPRRGWRQRERDQGRNASVSVKRTSCGRCYHRETALQECPATALVRQADNTGVRFRQSVASSKRAERRETVTRWAGSWRWNPAASAACRVKWRAEPQLRWVGP